MGGGKVLEMGPLLLLIGVIYFIMLIKEFFSFTYFATTGATIQIKQHIIKNISIIKFLFFIICTYSTCSIKTFTFINDTAPLYR